ncbi:MAG TPA: DUF2344 domain-containing protein [Phycisphaerales bacterium]|nr:DUF2344 domain-containing protein [Phycisphaerales bacterium]
MTEQDSPVRCSAEPQGGSPDGPPGGADITETVESQSDRGGGLVEPSRSPAVIVEFDVHGPLRFLSHAEMVRLFQRACVRAGIRVRHSLGFNPHPKMSLPLPRTVGVQCEGDVLFMWVESGPGGFGRGGQVDLRAFGEALGRQLPDGCRITEVRLSDHKSPPRPVGASFVIPLGCSSSPTDRQSAIVDLMDGEDIIVNRRSDRADRSKQTNIRPFLESFEFGPDGVTVRYAITGAGTVRLEEVLELLAMAPETFAGPVIRKDIRWN